MSSNESIPPGVAAYIEVSRLLGQEIIEETPRFTVIFGLEDKAVYGSFKEAFLDFYKRVLDQKPISHQFLSTCFIKEEVSMYRHVYPLDEIVRIVNLVGWVKKGKLVEGI